MKLYKVKRDVKINVKGWEFNPLFKECQGGYNELLSPVDLFVCEWYKEGEKTGVCKKFNHKDNYFVSVFIPYANIAMVTKGLDDDKASDLMAYLNRDAHIEDLQTAYEKGMNYYLSLKDTKPIKGRGDE